MRVSRAVVVRPGVFLVLLFAAASLVRGQQASSLDGFQKYKDDVAANPTNSGAHFRLGEAYAAQRNFQSAANEFRESLNGDQMPKWTDVWAHINLGKIFDMTGQCSRAVNEYNLALRTNDDAFGAQVEVENYLNAKIIRPLTRVPDEEGDGALPLGVHRPGTFVTSPIVLAKTQPEYSVAARLTGLEGTVALKAVIAEDGSPKQIRVARALGLGLDENAVEAVRAWRFAPGRYQGRPAPVEIDLAVDFFLQSRESRWHMVGVAFHPSEGVSEPVFVHVDYASGAGVARSAIDDARLVNAMRRFAAARLTFDVNESGVPVRFRVEHASEASYCCSREMEIQAGREERNARFGAHYY